MNKILKVVGYFLAAAGALIVVFMLFMAWHLGLFDRMAFAGPYGSQTKGNLGSIRSALSIYYGDMEGLYPADLAVIEQPRWLTTLPMAQTRIHPDSKKITPLTAEQIQAGQFTDSGGWYYVTTGANIGNVGVDCTHTDVKGSLWNQY